MALQQLTEVQKKMLNTMCISAQEVNMGTLLSNIITSVNEGGTGFVPVASIEVAGKVKASTEVVVDAEGVMSIGKIQKNKIIGLDEELCQLKQDIQNIEENGVSSTVVNKIDNMESSLSTVESDVDKVEAKIASMEEDITWGNF